MKIFPRILLNTLPLIILGMVIVGGLNYYLAQGALTNLAEKWLATKLNEGIRIATENVLTLRKYGLENVKANVLKAQLHSGSSFKNVEIGKKGFIWVVNGSGKVVMHPDNHLVGTSIQATPLFQDVEKRLNGKGFHAHNSEEMFVVYSYFPSWDWYLFASAPLQELYGEANKMRGYMISAGLFALIVTTVVLMVLARRLSAPINILANEAGRISRGEHRKLTEIDRSDEIGTLSLAFSRMTKQLEYRIEQEQLLSQISGEFIHINLDDPVVIKNVLEQIGLFARASRCYVLYSSDNGASTTKNEEWCKEHLYPKRSPEKLPCSLLSDYMVPLEKEGHVFFSSDDLPEKIYDKAHSIVWVALRYGGEFRGIVGVEFPEPYSWGDEIVSFLIRFSRIFSNSLERQWYQETLANEKKRLSVTLQSIGDGVITTDMTGRIVFINRVGENLTGWRQEDAALLEIGSVLRVIDEKTREPLPIILSEAADGNPTKSFLSRSILISKKGEERLVASSSAPILERENKTLGYVLVIRDITEKRRMEEEMVKVEKLESIGVLAGGIAHDFNNLLTAIIGNLSLVKEVSEKEPEVLQKLKEIEGASYRAQGLTQQLLTFSKGGEPIKKVVSIERLFKESAQFALGGSNCRLDFKPAPDIWMVEVDEGQLGQVVNNLVINSVQAMADGGVIEAFMENFMINEKSTLPLQPGRYIKIILKDYGGGISKLYLNKIFDPFFTTKAKGSGLGLATVYSIIEKHDGYITVDSRPGTGTKFTIYLPAVMQAEVAKPRRTAGRKVHESGTGRVLLMDDEREIREVVGKMLKNIGFSVDFAQDGDEMLEKYRNALESQRPYRAVLMDLTIPGGMGGKEAIGHLLKMDSSANAIVSSGYSNDPVMADFRKYGFKASVSKPYGLGELREVVSTVL